jgi:hypothetical protein
MKTNCNLKRVLSLLPILLISLTLFLSCLTPATVNAATTYIFTTFKGDAAADEKLWVYTSTDAVNYNLFSNTGFGGSTGVLRDPSIMKHTDGKYYIAFTIQSWTTSSTAFGIASSTDLINWTNVATVNAGVSGTYYTWAPEWFIDGSTVNIIVSLGPQGSNFKPYIFTAQNSSLTSWSSAVDMGIGTNHIDTFPVKSGSTYHVFCKNESTKYIEHATASSLTGPWTWVGTGNWANWGSGIEGPALVQMDSGTWRIYVDGYSGGKGILTATSSDLNSWSSLSAIGVTPSGIIRHGTVLRDTTLPTPTPTPSATPTPVGQTNLALNKTSSADSSQSGRGANYGNDGSTSTRWCANDGNTGHWWKVDLGSNKNIVSSEVMWESSGKVYKYKVETSTDNTNWTLKVDKTNNTSTAQIQTDPFTATARYVRITVTGLASGAWASFFEFRVFGN